ncbi:unnamed protein product [Phaedon cochleariae]|uniref:Partial AB-hydrolase lipase domain-containing protein n=1 Tax=Phaedon cochleariae TaxID=80249 RepID=A0A9P0DPQ3_PHACE|nr:unnamed protein product [Phaedon cochleariae]
MRSGLSGVSVSLVLGAIVIFSNAAIAQENNVCPTFKDYHTIKNNSRCWYDLAVEFNAPEIIQRMGYPLLTYKVRTADGYILTMFRIPNDHVKNTNARKHPIYLQHGLVSTCATFLGKGRDSLAFILSDAGYDVWLGNYRGNPYSEEHENMTIYDQEYWNHGTISYISEDDLQLESVPVFFNQLPGGTSIKILNHAADFVLGNFRKYNYGRLNPKYYGTSSSPIYDIKKLKLPVYLVFSGQDWVTPEADALNLWRNLPERSRHGMLKINRNVFNHIDMIYGRHAREWVYDPLVRVLNKAISS